MDGLDSVPLADIKFVRNWMMTVKGTILQLRGKVAEGSQVCVGMHIAIGHDDHAVLLLGGPDMAGALLDKRHFDSMAIDITDDVLIVAVGSVAPQKTARFQEGAIYRHISDDALFVWTCLDLQGNRGMVCVQSRQGEVPVGEFHVGVDISQFVQIADCIGVESAYAEGRAREDHRSSARS